MASLRVASVLLALGLSACGGGGPAATAVAPTGPGGDPLPDGMPEVEQRFDDRYGVTTADYETNRENTESTYAASGNFGSGAHYARFRDDILAFTYSWASDARTIVADVRSRAAVDDAQLANLVEFYRASFMDYMLASYDYFHSRANLSGTGPAQVRQEIIDGINVIFDDLQADL